jgi:hypothetical protein
MRILTFVLLLVGMAAAQDMSSCPVHNQSLRQADVESRGDEAMGFPHDKTTHHFRLAPDGGAIEVTVDDTKDTENSQAIRMHLKHILSMFADGNFSIPLFVHGQTPPGASEMIYRRGDCVHV